MLLAIASPVPVLTPFSILMIKHNSSDFFDCQRQEVVWEGNVLYSYLQSDRTFYMEWWLPIQQTLTCTVLVKCLLVLSHYICYTIAFESKLETTSSWLENNLDRNYIKTHIRRDNYVSLLCVWPTFPSSLLLGQVYLTKSSLLSWECCLWRRERLYLRQERMLGCYPYLYICLYKHIYCRNVYTCVKMCVYGADKVA